TVYLLKNPDHYTSYVFVPFYWHTFVTEACSVYHPQDTATAQPRLVLIKQHGKLVGLSSSFDYTHRPIEHEDYNLYDWIQRFQRVSKRKKKQ
ncbi:hypothetical protein BT96DRAFT_797520, partial [Gymnopus androsaceus JB14]